MSDFGNSFSLFARSIFCQSSGFSVKLWRKKLRFVICPCSNTTHIARIHHAPGRETRRGPVEDVSRTPARGDEVRVRGVCEQGLVKFSAELVM